LINSQLIVYYFDSNGIKHLSVKIVNAKVDGRNRMLQHFNLLIRLKIVVKIMFISYRLNDSYVSRETYG